MKIKNYNITCFSYTSNPKKIEGSYMLSINLDNKVSEFRVKVKNPEEAMVIIQNMIKGYEFEKYPNLKIEESKILGKHIFCKHHELYSTN